MRARRATALVLCLAAPIALAGWLAADELTARERQRADSRLTALLRSADAELAAVLAAAHADASSLARAPAVQLAVSRRDVDAVTRLERTFPGLVVKAYGRQLTGPRAGVAHVKPVPVIANGRPVGSIAIATPLDRALLGRLQLRAAVRLLFAEGGRVVAGAPMAAGGSIVLTGLGPQSLVVAGRRYRAVAAAVPDSAARLVALMPLAVVQKAEDRQVRIVIVGALGLLLVLTVGVDATTAVRRRRRGP